MSSWANRGIPRKRDLSQIPDTFRPTIITRDQQPQVIQSELYMNKPQTNEVIYPDSYNPSFLSSNTKPSNQGSSRLTKTEPHAQYPITPIHTAPTPQAKELRFEDRSYVFVILRHLRTTRDNDLWISSYNSIRKFYTNQIIIIDDNSSINTVNGKLVNTDIIYSEYRGAGEILPYYYFLKNKWADRMVFLHDSMFLHRAFTNEELSGDIRFHWHFTNKNDQRKLSTYLTMLSHSDELYTFSQESEWKGCFGVTSIVDWEVVSNLDTTYGIFSNLILAIRTRADRELFERIFGIVVTYHGLIQDKAFSNFGDIIKYPNAFESTQTSYAGASHAISQAGYDSAIIKVWRGR